MKLEEIVNKHQNMVKYQTFWYKNKQKFTCLSAVCGENHRFKIKDIGVNSRRKTTVRQLTSKRICLRYMNNRIIVRTNFKMIKYHLYPRKNQNKDQTIVSGTKSESIHYISIIQ